MDKPTRWQILKIKLGLGHPFAKEEDLGAVDHTVIRFKGFYLSVMERDGEIVSLGWSKDPHMFPDVNTNDFWTAQKGKS